MRAITSIDMLKETALKLGPLGDEIVFLGGTAAALLITDPAAASPRITDDVDCIIKADKLKEYYQFAERLQQRGFVLDRLLRISLSAGE